MDTSEYRQEIYTNGVLTSVIDTRTVQNYCAVKVAEAKAACNEAILAAAPLHHQNNAALGLLTDDEKTAVTTAITNFRNQCHAIEAALNAATTLDEIDAVIIQFTS